MAEIVLIGAWWRTFWRAVASLLPLESEASPFLKLQHSVSIALEGWKGTQFSCCYCSQHPTQALHSCHFRASTLEARSLPAITTKASPHSSPCSRPCRRPQVEVGFPWGGALSRRPHRGWRQAVAPGTGPVGSRDATTCIRSDWGLASSCHKSQLLNTQVSQQFPVRMIV